MIKNIVAKLKGIYIGWDYDKYWDCREALFDPKTCRLKFYTVSTMYLLQIEDKMRISHTALKQEITLRVDLF